MEITQHLGKPILPEEIHPGDGLLTDAEIKLSVKHNLLLTGVDYTQARYASYELRIGQKVVTLVTDAGTAESQQYHEKSIDYKLGEKFFINPGQTMKLFTAENMAIPANIMALVLPIGNLYRLGLSPETTFADPGFAGEFWVVVSNYSGRVVELSVGDPLARMQFFKFSGRPDKVHQGAGGVRKPETFPKRPERQDLTGLENNESKLLELLKDVLLRVDPPHYEHTFITGAIRSNNSMKLAKLEASLKKLRRFTTALGVIALIYICTLILPSIPYLWNLLPDDLRKKLIEELWTIITVGFLGMLASIILLLTKWSRRRIWTPLLRLIGLGD